MSATILDVPVADFDPVDRPPHHLVVGQQAEFNDAWETLQSRHVQDECGNGAGHRTILPRTVAPDECCSRSACPRLLGWSRNGTKQDRSPAVAHDVHSAELELHPGGRVLQADVVNRAWPAARGSSPAAGAPAAHSPPLAVLVLPGGCVAESATSTPGRLRCGIGRVANCGVKGCWGATFREIRAVGLVRSSGGGRTALSQFRGSRVWAPSGLRWVGGSSGVRRRWSMASTTVASAGGGPLVGSLRARRLPW